MPMSLGLVVSFGRRPEYDRRAMRDPEGKALVEACLGKDDAARKRFQQQFGHLVYAVAGHLTAAATIEPGDFYLYVFDRDRLFGRLRSYRGEATLAAFLRSYVLPDLFRDFVRVAKRRAGPESISLDTGDVPALAASQPALDAEVEGSAPPRPAKEREVLSDQLTAENRVLLKLLYLEDFDLCPQDVQLIATQSGRSIRETVDLVDRARETVRVREAEKQAHLEDAQSAAEWILRYERQLARLRETISNLPAGFSAIGRLLLEETELERKRIWRQQQQQSALARNQRARTTLRYCDIANILSIPIGSVAARVTRLRQELVNLAPPSSNLPEEPK